MNKTDFLLEIGVEELPVDHIKPAMDYLRTAFEKLLSDSRLSHGTFQTGSTPRRMAILISDLDTAQEDIEIIKVGPSIRISYTESGDLSPAALGFLKKTGASSEDIYIDKSEKGEFIAIRIQQKGQATKDILRCSIPDMISSIPFGKRMIWSDLSFSFSRPIRWIAALWGKEILPLEICNIQSGRSTRAVRRLGLEQEIELSEPNCYFEALLSHSVIADREERKQLIHAQLLAISASADYRVIIEEKLLETVVDMVESPNAVIAEFEAYFLKLPTRIITSTISQNQKYFAIESKHSAELLNKFVFISNGDPACAGIIRNGNEKVVKPRLADAMWYFEEDTKRPLESFLPALSEVVFHSKLGTVADKCQRIMQIAEYICRELKLNELTTRNAIRAAQLCKADLVTLMLGEKEFTKLQGYMGRVYALQSGEAPAVADAIYEHYMPKGQGDDLPESECGAIVAIADKLDTVCGISGIGLMPTGSGDPFALRRAANGIVQILAARDWNINLASLISFATGLFADKVVNTTQESVKGFFQQRTQWLLKYKGLDYDIIDSVMHIDISLLPNLVQRASALQQIRNLPDFIRLVIGFKRVSNIISTAKDIPMIDPLLFEAEAERALYIALQTQQQEIERRLQQADYANVLQSLISLGADIDHFFDQVLVNCEDPTLKQNRYALLQLIRNEFLQVADLSLIAVEISES